MFSRSLITVWKQSRLIIGKKPIKVILRNMLSKTIQILSKLVSIHLSASVKILELIHNKAIIQEQVCQVFHTLCQLPISITTRAMSGSHKLESLVRVKLDNKNMLHSNKLAHSQEATVANFKIKLNLRHKTP